ncbi:MAG: TlpA disulfide reductase family protein [Saprospiraceae bacterium]
MHKPFIFKLLFLSVLIFSTQNLEAQINLAEAPNLYSLDIQLFNPADSSATSSKKAFKKGKGPVVIAFWLTTCQPCLRELSAYSKLYDNWQKEADFQLAAISIDYPQRFYRVGEIVQEKAFPFPSYWDGARQFKEVLPGRLNGLPQLFIFDKNGKLVYHHKGFQTGDEVKLFEEIKKWQ